MWLFFEMVIGVVFQRFEGMASVEALERLGVEVQEKGNCVTYRWLQKELSLSSIKAQGFVFCYLDLILCCVMDKNIHFVWFFLKKPFFIFFFRELEQFAKAHSAVSVVWVVCGVTSTGMKGLF